MIRLTCLSALLLFLPACGGTSVGIGGHAGSYGSGVGVGTRTTLSRKGPRDPLRHVVLFRFKAGTTPQQIQAIETAFAGLPRQIRQIRDLEWGTNVSPEGLAQDYTHCFLVTFDNAADRDVYLSHPDHLAFVELLKPALDEAHVLDYFARR